MELRFNGKKNNHADLMDTLLVSSISFDIYTHQNHSIINMLKIIKLIKNMQFHISALYNLCGSVLYSVFIKI